MSFATADLELGDALKLPNAPGWATRGRECEDTYDIRYCKLLPGFEDFPVVFEVTDLDQEDPRYRENSRRVNDRERAYELLLSMQGRRIPHFLARTLWMGMGKNLFLEFDATARLEIGAPLKKGEVTPTFTRRALRLLRAMHRGGVCPVIYPDMVGVREDGAPVFRFLQDAWFRTGLSLEKYGEHCSTSIRELGAELERFGAS